MGARRIISFLAILVLVTGLSACKKKDGEGTLTTGGEMNTTTQQTIGSSDPNGPAPGSQQLTSATASSSVTTSMTSPPKPARPSSVRPSG